MSPPNSTTYQEVAATLTEVTRVAEPWPTAAARAQPVIVLTEGSSSRMSHSALRKREATDRIRFRKDLETELGLRLNAQGKGEAAKEPEDPAAKAGAEGSGGDECRGRGGNAMNRPVLSPPAEAGLAPEPYVRLFEAFGREGVAWCGWKSPRRLAEAFAGRSDLDVLIARADRHNATRILTDCGFKLAPDAPGRDDAAIASFLGFDPLTGALMHVHAHFRLILGPPLFKNWRLPCEAGFLARSQELPDSGFRTLSDADAALLLFVRAQIERSVLDPVHMRRRAAIEEKYRQDFAGLAPLDEEAVRRSAAEIFDGELAREAARAIVKCDPMAPSAGLRRKVARALSPYRLYGGVEAPLRRAGRTTTFLFGAFNRRHLRVPRLWGRQAPGGGALVAFIGADGSGKSTATNNVRDWLGAEIDVIKIYFGTGDGSPSLLLAPVKIVAEAFARVVKTRPKGASHGRISDKPPGLVYSVLFALWAVAVALDKKHKLTLIQRALRRGFVVVTDRYPQKEIEGFNEGPMLYRVPRAPGWLRRFEDAIYERARKTPPDLVIKLLVGPETVVRREPDMSRAVIEQRVENVKRLRFAAAKIIDIDATAPLAQVTDAIKRAVWRIV